MSKKCCTFAQNLESMKKIYYILLLALLLLPLKNLAEQPSYHFTSLAEALDATLLFGDLSVATAFKIIGFPIKVQRDAGAEGRLAVSLSFHRGQHLVHVVLIAAMLTGITRRIHARGTTQGLHFETRVVGEAIDMIAVCDKVCLDLGIAFDGVGIFNDVLVTANVVKTQDLIKAFHNLAHLAQFVFVIGGEDDLFHLEFKDSKI